MKTLKITALSSQGEGIGRLEGIVHFVPRTLPGEVWEVEVTEAKKKWRRAWPLRMLESSPDRIEPWCRYYAECGGCQLQHLAYPRQLEFKQQALRENLEKLAGITVEPEPIQFEEPYHYRIKITFAVRVIKGRLRLCLHHFEDSKKFVHVARCEQATQPINKSLKPFEEWLNRRQWGKHRPNRVIVQERNGAVVWTLVFPEKAELPAKDALPELPEGTAAIYYDQVRSGQGPRLLVGRERESYFPGAFRQSYPEMGARLFQDIVRETSAVSGRVVDAYCGAGQLTLELAKPDREVIGIELDRQALAEAEQAKKSVQPEGPVRFVRGRVEHKLSKWLPADLLVLDPPREGCTPEVMDSILKKPVQQICYVSCHPAALARDLKKLIAEGYELKKLIPYDLFPQTFHLEVAAFLKK